MTRAQVDIPTGWLDEVETRRGAGLVLGQPNRLIPPSNTVMVSESRHSPLA
jgi:hypothetical protein